jgi:hypothetical protein
MKSLESASTQKPATTENSPAALRALEIAPKQFGDRPDKGGHLRMALIIHRSSPVRNCSEMVQQVLTLCDFLAGSTGEARLAHPLAHLVARLPDPAELKSAKLQ